MDTELAKTALLEGNYITEEDATAALACEKAGKSSFIDYLIQHEIISRATLGQALAEHYGLTFANLDIHVPTDDDLRSIPEEVARKYRLVFVKENKDGIVLATDTPDSAELKTALTAGIAGKKATLTYAFPDAIDAALSRHQTELNTRFSDIIKAEKRVAPELFEEIVRDAFTYRASDIHFEPQSDKTVIRFRIDGMLELAGSMPREHYESVLNRIKIQANLRTDEHFASQDGAIRFESEKIRVDLRVSIIPALEGEKTVIRILAEYVKGLEFKDLGFSSSQVARLEAASKKPFGMILVSGPTGSGKTTTLYSLIRKLNTPKVNITTIEDPVEYRMKGTNQIQVNQKTDLTFAKGLRAIVRQDPNVILVGEIRDTETAEVAVNAALTGHLLLSTFHANDASTCVPRLLDMEVEPFLLASTLELIVAQRLARRICTACRESYQAKPTELARLVPNAATLFPGRTTTLYRSKGCTACNGTGYRGRVCLVEMIETTPAIKELIVRNPSATDIWSAAAAGGAVSMFADGVEKAKLAVTTLEEVLRVATPPAATM